MADISEKGDLTQTEKYGPRALESLDKAVEQRLTVSLRSSDQYEQTVETERARQHSVNLNRNVTARYVEQRHLAPFIHVDLLPVESRILLLVFPVILFSAM